MTKRRRSTAPNIIDFITDTNLLGLSLSDAQETLLRTVYGLPLSKTHLELYRQCTGRENAPKNAFSEVTVVAGARAGKDSRIAAPIVSYEALFGGHEKHLQRGERAIIPLVAQDQRATKIAFGYIRDYLTGSPLLASMVQEVLALEIALTNRLTISCFPSTLRSLRGWSIPVGVLDELAFFRMEGAADSDAEIQASIRRGMLSFPNPRLIKISTPYMKSGVLFEDFKIAFGQDDPDRLVWRASSTLMNPSLKEARLDRERRLDPQRFEREYMAEFAEDLDAFLPSAWIEDAVMPGRHELPPQKGVHYKAAVDPSGGGADAFTLAVCHTEGNGSDTRVIQDVMRGWRRSPGKQLDLEGMVKEIASILEPYHVSFVTGDRYAAGWVRERFRAEGVYYRDTDMTKAEAYLESQPLFAQGRVDLLDQAQLIRELKLLESRPRAGGRTLVDHPRGGHDDYANAVALGAVVATKGATTPFSVPKPRGPLYRPSPFRSLSEFDTLGRRP